MSGEDKVISIFAKKEEPYLAGTCFCFSCRHEWAGCSPIGAIELECPECHSMKGRMKFEVVRDELHWRCLCDNPYFSITPTCIYCPNCGEKQRQYD